MFGIRLIVAIHLCVLHCVAYHLSQTVKLEWGYLYTRLTALSDSRISVIDAANNTINIIDIDNRTVVQTIDSSKLDNQTIITEKGIYSFTVDGVANYINYTNYSSSFNFSNSHAVLTTQNYVLMSI